MGAGGQAGGRKTGLDAAGLTEELARFLAASRWEDIPRSVRREGKRAILNIAGCVLAGRNDPAVQLLRATFPAEQALLDAAAATAHDYDDTHLRTVIHATPPVAGVLFELAKEQSISGAEFLHALVLGMETTCRLGNAVTPGHYERGWHITSTCGVFGAAAAAGKILRLNETQFIAGPGHRRHAGRGAGRSPGEHGARAERRLRGAQRPRRRAARRRRLRGAGAAARRPARLLERVRRQQGSGAGDGSAGRALGNDAGRLQALSVRRGAACARRRLPGAARKDPAEREDRGRPASARGRAHRPSGAAQRASKQG